MKNLLIHKKIKLTTILTFALAGSVLTTTIILLVFSYHIEKSILMETYLTLNSSKSNKMSQSVNSLMKSMKGSLETSAQFFTNKENMSKENIQQSLNLLRTTNRYFNSLTLIDENGLEHISSPINANIEGKTLTNDVIIQLLDSKQPSLTKPFFDTNGQLLLLMSHPIYNELGEYKGIIGGSIYFQEKNVLNDVLGNDIVEESGSYYYVVGPEGKLLFHPLHKRLGENVKSNPIVQKLINGEDGKEHVINSKGNSFIAAYNNVPEIGWGIVQQTPEKYINSLLVERTKRLIFYIFVPFVALIILTMIFAQKLTKPFVYLAELTNRVASGNIVSLPEIKSHWNREVDLLTKSVIIAIQYVQGKNESLLHAATTDSLTGLPNRRKFGEVIESTAKECETFSLIFLDIDKFKVINDTYGHTIGDDVLIHVADIISKNVMSDNLCFRYGGEEFVIVAPKKSAIEAYRISEKIRKSIAKTKSPVGTSVTISLGIAQYPIHSRSIKELFTLADKAMYESKQKGRNRTTICAKNLSSKRTSHKE